MAKLQVRQAASGTPALPEAARRINDALLTKYMNRSNECMTTVIIIMSQ